MSDWQDDAACRGVDPGIFFPPAGNVVHVRRAMSFCNSCSVTEECLDYWLALPFGRYWKDEGIVGGTNPNQRRAIRAARKQLAAAR